MDKDTRSAIERATQKARRLLQDDLAAQLEGHFDVLLSGTVEAKPGEHLSARERLQREKIVAAIEHKRAAGMRPDEAVADYIRDAAFTTLNRFVALKMLEARDLVQECISRGEQSGGYKEFCGMAPGLALLPDAAGYRLYVESLFDELSVEIKVLFDRRDAASVLWPRRQTFDDLLAILNAQELASVWAEDETIGWMYQYFNSGDERRAMRDASLAPRNSRELAVRNQFFTPRYVVQFLTDNTLGRTWYEMRKGDTVLRERCEYMVRRPSDVFLAEGEKVPPEEPTEGVSHEELLRRTVHVPHRPKKDPRDLRILDPACGSGHFLLYAFDLLLAIYEEAWADPEPPKSEATGRTLAVDFPDRQALLREAPVLILQHNLHGVDIDPRCAQISQLALWMRAQRAFRDLSQPRAERPRIRRSNIVLAEPMPGEADLLRDFTANLGDSNYAELFTTLVDTMKLAGELGLLLRLERFVLMPDKGQLNLLAPPEERIRGTLLRFLNASGDDQRTRRRLFADDADHGLALLELAGKRFDVVLMNPPFGDAGERSAQEIEKGYPSWCRNLVCAFVIRAASLLAPDGSVGAILDRTVSEKSTYEPFRRTHFLGQIPLRIVADLGWNVLDANVETAAIVLSPSVRYFGAHLWGTDLRESSSKADDLRTQSGRGTVTSLDAIAKLPNAVIGYYFPSFVTRIFERFASLKEQGAEFFEGHTLKSARYFRFAWEIPGDDGGQRWLRMFNGTPYSRFAYPHNEVVLLGDGGAVDGDESAVLRNGPKHLRPGVCYGKRGDFIDAQLLPPGFISTVEGKACLIESQTRAQALLGLLNSRLFQFVINLYTGQHKYSGYVEQFPCPDWNQLRLSGEIALAISDAKWSLFQRVETSPTFVRPWLSEHISPIAEISAVIGDLEKLARSREEDLNHAVYAAYGLTEAEAGIVDRWCENEPVDAIPFLKSSVPVEVARMLFQYLQGVAFGRWDIEAAIKKSPHDAGTPLPWVPPGAKLPRPASSILVDDVGHRDDQLDAILTPLVARRYVENDLRHEIGTDLRDYLRTQAFDFHLAFYKVGSRKAPIYWQLATPSASYSVWLYLHAFSADTLYKVQNEYVEPKLRHEEQKLDGLRREYGDSPTASQRKELDSQETFVAELRTFLDEVKRVAPLWKPDLDDGVIINFAPLWRLVQHHRPWQKECKTTWDALAEGEYDWSHLAMHLWPERVVPKCQQDRSLAIAHGLEEIFWAGDSDGKWKPRPTPTRPLNDLIKERTSSAVKAALDSLLSAPHPGGTSRSRGKGKRMATGGES
jgi:hypothetical protein